MEVYKVPMFGIYRLGFIALFGLMAGCATIPDEPIIPAHYQNRYNYCVAHPETNCPGYGNYYERQTLTELRRINRNLER